MKAIIWKEWRETLLCGVSALLAVALICSWMLHQALTSNGGWEAVWTQGIMQPFTIMAPLVGAVLGALQIVPELKRDQWAFLIHRPLEIGTMFWGKVLAGLSLYFLAMLLPLAGAALWLSQPGHTQGPFIGQMFLPAIADILGGVMFYFAAILATLRLSKSRLSYVRVLVFGFALACVVWSLSVVEFWQSIVIVALGILVVGSAAWGSFISLDNYGKQPVKARAGLIITLYTGIAVVVIACFAFVGSLVPSAPSDYFHTEHRVNKAGQIVKVTQSRNGTTVTDLQGKPIKPTNGDNGVNNDLINETTLNPQTQQLWEEGYRYPQRYVLPIGSGYQSSDNESWFYVRRRHWFEVYSGEKHLREGFLGPQGFSKLPPQKQFADGLQRDFLSPSNQIPRNHIFQFADAVYWIDFSARRLSLLQQAPLGQKNFAGQDIAANSYTGYETSWGAVVVANEKIRFFSRQGQLRFEMPLKFPSDEYQSLRIAPVSDDKLILRQSGYKEIKGEFTALPIQVREVSGSGQVLKQYQVPPITLRNVETPSLYPFAALVPPGVMPLYTAYSAVGSALGNEATARDFKRLKHSAPMWWTLTLLTALAALPCAILAWRFGLQHQVSAKMRWIWAISVFWSGVYGLITLWVLREWPPRMVCENCGKMRSVAQESCATCQAAWPAPALDGTEIFA